MLDLNSTRLEGGEALSRSYGRFFAEFLNDESLVPLGLLALSTCVGLRYGFRLLNSRELFSEDASRTFAWKTRRPVGTRFRLSTNNAKPIRHARLFSSHSSEVLHSTNSANLKQ